MPDRKPLYGFLVAVVLCGISILVYKFFLETKESFLLDNPTDKTIIVQLNGEDYILAPGQAKNITIKAGENRMFSSTESGEKLVSDTILNITKTDRGVINPTRSEYYTFRRYYGYIKNLDSLYKSNKTLIDNKEYIGEINKHNGVLLQDFYFNINQEFPKVITKVDSIESRIKIFRKDQFLEFYQKSFE